MPRRPGSTLGKEPDDPSKRVSPDFEKVRSEIATHRRLDFLARRRHAAASFAAEAQKTTKVLDQRDAEVREFERKRREAYEAERQRREAERRATMDRLIEEYKQKEAMWEEEKELYEQTWQTRQTLRERELDEKNKRLQEKATQKDAERKAFLQRKQEQDEAKDRYLGRGIELRESERVHKLNLKHQAEKEAAAVRAAKSRAVAERARQCLEKSKEDTTAEYLRQIEEKERQVHNNLMAKASRHEASLRASAEVERLLAIRRENVHKSREDKDAKIARELIEKEKKLKENISKLEVRKQKAQEEREKARLEREDVGRKKREKMRIQAEHASADLHDFHEAAETREANRKAAIDKLIHTRRLATTKMADMQKAAQEKLMAAQTVTTGNGAEMLMMEAERDAKAMRLAAQLAAEKAAKVSQELKEKADQERLKAEKGVRESGRRSAQLAKEKREKPLASQIDSIQLMSTMG